MLNINYLCSICSPTRNPRNHTGQPKLFNTATSTLKDENSRFPPPPPPPPSPVRVFFGLLPTSHRLSRFNLLWPRALISKPSTIRMGRAALGVEGAQFLHASMCWWDSTGAGLLERVFFEGGSSSIGGSKTSSTTFTHFLKTAVDPSGTYCRLSHLLVEIVFRFFIGLARSFFECFPCFPICSFFAIAIVAARRRGGAEDEKSAEVITEPRLEGRLIARRCFCFLPTGQF